jgi:hypothetical protein
MVHIDWEKGLFGSGFSGIRDNEYQQKHVFAVFRLSDVAQV